MGLSAECYDKHFAIFILIKNSHLFTYNRTASLCEKRDISKYRLSQLSGISQSSLGRIMAQENLLSLITLEKICIALGVTLSQFFQEGNSENLTEKQKEVLRIWNNLSTNEQETVMSMLRGLRK